MVRAGAARGETHLVEWKKLWRDEYAPRAISPLKRDEEVEVLKMAPEENCMQRMLVLVRFAGRKFGVPLDQLDPLKADEATREAIEDWKYWVRMGYEP